MIKIRMVMLMAGAASIREVIAFPKVQNSSDLMTEAPSPVADKQLEELAIAVTTAASSNEDDDLNLVTD